MIFHGANRVWKGEPWYFQNQVDNTLEYEMFKKLGFNVVRLGYMWSGVEPNEGEFNSTYTDIVEVRSREERSDELGIRQLKGVTMRSEVALV